MIDFVSTRATTDLQTRGAARLLAAIMAEFVRCASIPPTKEEAKVRHNINEAAHNGIVYLFGDDSSFAAHAELIGVQAEAMRKALLDNTIKLKDGAEFSEFQRRTIQIRYRWWKADPTYVPPHVEDDTEESESDHGQA